MLKSNFAIAAIALLAVVGTLTLAATVSAAIANEQLRMCKRGERNTPSKTCVVDGDTLWLHGVDYRMKGYDTPEPETDICGGSAEVALAHKSSVRFLALLNGNTWTIDSFGPDRTGRRVLATIRISGRDIGDILIAERLARHWPNGDEWWCNN